MPVILATQEAEIRRTEVRSQPGQIVLETLSRKKTITKKRAGAVAQGVGPEFKPQYCKTKHSPRPPKPKNKYQQRADCSQRPRKNPCAPVTNKTGPHGMRPPTATYDLKFLSHNSD
jgi:hypothetical protein